MEKDRGEQDNPAEGEQTGHVRWGERRYREDSPGPVLAWHAAAPSHAPVSSYLEISAFRDYLRGLNNSLVLSWYILHMAHFLTSPSQVRAQKPQPLSIFLKLLVRLAASLTDACFLLFTRHSRGPGEFLTCRGSSVRLVKGCRVITGQGRHCTGCVPCFQMHHEQCEEIGLGHKESQPLKYLHSTLWCIQALPDHVSVSLEAVPLYRWGNGRWRDLINSSEVGLCLYLQTGQKFKSSFQSPGDVPIWACYNPAQPLWSHCPSVFSSPFPALGGRGQTDSVCAVYPNYTLWNCRKSSSQLYGCQ